MHQRPAALLLALAIAAAFALRLPAGLDGEAPTPSVAPVAAPSPVAFFAAPQLPIEREACGVQHPSDPKEDDLVATPPVAANASLQLEPGTARDVSAAMAAAWDDMWQWKTIREEVHWPETTSSAAREFAIAVWPDLPRMIAAGKLKPSCSKRVGAVDPLGMVSFTITPWLVTVWLRWEHLEVGLPFTATDNPRPDLFARIGQVVPPKDVPCEPFEIIRKRKTSR